MSNLQEHEAEQAAITAICESEACDHPDCRKSGLGWHDACEAVMWRGRRHPTSDDNNRRAAHALQTYYPDYDNDTALLGLIDFLSDVRHLCDLMDWNFAEIDGKAHGVYQDELRDCGVAADPVLRTAIERDLC
ncbi:hypothetical protein [Paenirhodobacter populi]|uniref:hypothetical protein n=1 Tax=Paenirhodobacter populi TaxID=2306993 RepID=UPI0013E3EE39|nr:hypothetical protein [Sinirhodobacter populi]